MFVIFTLTKDLDYKLSFGIAGAFCFLIAVFIFFAVKDVRINKKIEDHLTLRYLKLSLRFLYRERISFKTSQGWSEIKSKSELPISFIGIMLCRMNNLISTVYVTLWISSFYSRDAEGQ